MSTLLELPSSPETSGASPDPRAEGVADRTPATNRRLEQVSAHSDFGRIEWERPGPSAAFSRRDASTPGFARAVATMSELGFEPFIRPVGGRLAAYHEGALVLDVLTRNDDVRPGTTERFRAMSQALALGLSRLGVDARVGEVPGEYCPGTWSVNTGGTRKLVGTGQRLARGSALFTAVIVVSDPEPLREAMSRGYADLGLDMDPATVGAISDVIPGVTLDDVQSVLTEALTSILDLDGLRLLAPWDPR